MFEMGELDRGRALAPVQDCLQGNTNYNYNLHQYQQAVHQHNLNYAQANHTALNHSQTVGHQSAPLYQQAPEQTCDYYQGELQTAAAAVAAAAYNHTDQSGQQRLDQGGQVSYRRLPEAGYYNTHTASPYQAHQQTSELSYYHSNSYYLLDSGCGATNSNPTYYHFSNGSHEFNKQGHYNGNEQYQLRSSAETAATANAYEQLGTPKNTTSESSLTSNSTSQKRVTISGPLNQQQQQQFAKSCRFATERANAGAQPVRCEPKLASSPKGELSASLGATSRRARTHAMGSGREQPDGCVVIARRKNATRSTTIIMKLWLRVRCRNPYPTRAEKSMLVKSSSMTNTQVSTWLANARRRLKKEGKFYEWMNHRPPQQQRRAASELMDEMMSSAANRPGRPQSACSSSSSTASSSVSGSSSSSLEALVTAASAAIANAPDEVKTFVTSLIRTATRKRRPGERAGPSSVVSPPLSISSSSPSAACSSSSRCTSSSTNGTSLVALRSQLAASDRPVGQPNLHSKISQSNRPTTTTCILPDCPGEFAPSLAKL